MCWNGLYYNLPSPPDYSTIENTKSSTFSLGPGSSQSLTFTNITSADTGVWHMYGLADCDNEIAEISESNNYKGPVDIHWRAAPKPDLVIQSLTVENYSPVVTEHTNGSIVVKNQSSNPVTGWFYTDVFKNRASAPYPPANGEYYWGGGPLMPGATETYYFYKLPTCLEPACPPGTTWKMWGLVDSWSNIQETDESNNAFGPVNIKWSSPPAPHYVSRDEIIQNAEDFAFVEWYCSSLNVQYHWACTTWTCAFGADSFYTGEAYSWGGWDKPVDFYNYLMVGLCAGSYSGNNCGATDAYWATGTDCSGLVSRCWELGSRQTTGSLQNFSHQIPVENLRRGDIMLKQGSHVRMFVEWYDWHQEDMWVIEATPRRAIKELYNLKEDFPGYLAYEYNYISAPPNIAGDCNSDGKIDIADVIYLAKYVQGIGVPPDPLWKGDVNGDCKLNLQDVIILSKYVFYGSPVPWCNSGCPDWDCE